MGRGMVVWEWQAAKGLKQKLEDGIMIADTVPWRSIGLLIDFFCFCFLPQLNVSERQTKFNIRQRSVFNCWFNLVREKSFLKPAAGGANTGSNNLHIEHEWPV